MPYYECVLKWGKPCKSSDTIGQGKWDSLQSKSQNWSGLDKFGDVYNTTSWQAGGESLHASDMLYLNLICRQA
jgi:hypothetical protein